MSEQAFALPERLEAHEPAEARGLARDDVRLLVSDRADGSIVHAHAHDLPRFLAPGDLLVVNVSATVPAALDATRADGTTLELRLSTPAPDREPEHDWVVELRRGDEPFGGGRTGDRLSRPGGAAVQRLAPFAGRRLWLAHLDLPVLLEQYLAAHGRPIRYSYVPRSWPLDAYQNAYAREPGSAEMASAGRPLTAELITRLVAGGVLVAPVTLHTGVSSPERHEPPYPERFRVPETTARLVDAVHGWDGRVVAVGTTVVRALETVARHDGSVVAGEGWTKLVVTPERGLWTVDGLLTGLHEPDASHVDLLRAAAGETLVDRSYREAIEHGYRWHEFGDSHLILG